MNQEQRIRYVFDAICQYKLDNDGNTPTRDELATITATNKTTLHTILAVLEGRGQIRRDSNRNKAAKIYVVGGVWLPPEGWESPAEAQRRAEERQRKQSERERLLKKAAAVGLLCECGKDVVRWQKKVRFPRVEILRMCTGCVRFEKEQYGDAGIEAIPVEELQAIN